MSDHFGCESCSGEDPVAVWAYYRGGLMEDIVLIDESHFLVSLRHCRDCGQPFVWIFTEEVDLVGGNDPQFRMIVPVNPDEARALADSGDGPDLGGIGALGEGRRFLAIDWPADAQEARVFWRRGRFALRDGHGDGPGD